MNKKLFHISDVLSITTGKLVSTRHIGGVYDILGFMTGESLMTHQLPRAMRECQPVLLAQFPVLEAIEVPNDLTGRRIRTRWLAEQSKRFGAMFEVRPLPKRKPQYDTPIADAIEMMGDPTRVLVVEP